MLKNPSTIVLEGVDTLFCWHRYFSRCWHFWARCWSLFRDCLLKIKLSLPYFLFLFALSNRTSPNSLHYQIQTSKPFFNHSFPCFRAWCHVWSRLRDGREDPIWVLRALAHHLLHPRSMNDAPSIMQSRESLLPRRQLHLPLQQGCLHFWQPPHHLKVLLHSLQSPMWFQRAEG